MKAIIPVAGAGTRLRPHTYTQPKALIPVAGKPILGHIIDQLLDAGVEEFIFIIGYLGEKVKQYVEEKYTDLSYHFVVQEDRSGVGHAIWSARELFEGEKDLFITLGDTIVDAELKDMLKIKSSAVGVKKVQDPRDFGVAVMDDKDVIRHLVEKPDIPKSNMALVGIYLIRNCAKLFNVLDEMIGQEDRSHGEFQLTDALMGLIDNGEEIRGFRVNGWYDLGKMDVLLDTNAILLRKIGDLAKAEWERDNVIVVEPVSVSEGAKISNAIIGPNVTIGEHTHIDGSIVRNSIIGSYASLKNVTLVNSLIGNDTSISGSVHKLNIGDNTNIDLSGGK